MRVTTLSLLTLALAASTLLPAAQADQTIGTGDLPAPLPVSASVQSQGHSGGSGSCDDQGEGYSYETGSLDVAVAPDDDHQASAGASSHCSRSAYGDWSWNSQQLYTGASYCSYGGCVGVAHNWYNYQGSYPGGQYAYCNSYAYVDGLYVGTGCPSPDGSPPPQVPVVPDNLVPAVPQPVQDLLTWLSGVPLPVPPLP